METLTQPLVPPALEELTEEQEFLLRKCENIIRIGLATFVEVGLALKEIQDGRLYRKTDATFEEYLQRAMGLSRPYAYNLIESAKLMRELRSSPELDKSALPKNEAQARELVRVPPEQRMDVWKKVVAASDGKPFTAKLIREVASREKFREATSWNASDLTLGKVKRLRELFAHTRVAADALQLIEKLEELARNLDRA
ncbi:MAG: hypothetical protein RLZZ399_2454 [Verrucomicrobiota bacterium]|jgi:hypothetical protein